MYHHPEYIEQDNCLLALRVALDFSMVPIHIVDISSAYDQDPQYMLQAYQADHLHFLVPAVQKQFIRRFHEGLSRPDLKSRYHKS